MALPRIIDIQFGQATTNVLSVALTQINPTPLGGELLVVAQSYFNASNVFVPTAPTDGPGNTYTQVGSTITFGTNIGLAWWYAIAKPGSTTITVHQTSAGTCAGVVWYVRNMRTDTPFNNDVVVTNTGVSGAPPMQITSATAFDVRTANQPPQTSMQFGVMTHDNADVPIPQWQDLTYGMDSARLARAKVTNNTTSQALFTSFNIPDPSIKNPAWFSTGNRVFAVATASFACDPATLWYVDGGGILRQTK